VAVDVKQLAADLDAETRELERLLDPLAPNDWDRPTPAVGWTIRDQISHLAFFDDAATTAAVDPDRFRADLEVARTNPESITETAAARLRDIDAQELYAWFRRARASMIDAFVALDPSTRVPWYGPDMSIASSLTARIMETWAHGQDVADALGATRTPTPALRQVAHIGARTLPNSFVARGLEVPVVPVYVELNAPSGEVWTWGEPGSVDAVVGDAIEFCLVVTQRRHLDDTDLTVTGPVAGQWMRIAQAFAGPPGPGRSASA
jgi:uncharacterized protein (TIGR03084 family)